MTTSDQPRQSHQPDTDAGQLVHPSIIDEASQPGVDPCDVACDAMPGYLVGDLSTPEEVWLHEHTADCGYCARMLGSYEQVNSALDATSRTVARPTRSVAEALGLREARYGFLDDRLRRDLAVHAGCPRRHRPGAVRPSVDVWGDCPPDRQARRGAGRWKRAWPQSAPGRGALPPGDPRRRLDGLVHRRRRDQAPPARP
jgi:hypothetical protein